MRLPARDKLVPLGLALGCFVLALVQRPGLASSDTKIDLHVDPSGFLGDVAAVWSPTGSLGHIQGGQYGGYLWPMGPFFALLHGIGLAPWLVQRLWLGAVLAVGAWGVVRLLDALLDTRRGTAHVVAGALFVVNPYVVVFSSRTTITLLGYALLPWLLLTVHRGVRQRGWWWPAAFALLITSSGGGVNAAVTGWLLVGPLLLLFYEPLLQGVGWKPTRAFAWRAIACTAIASAWWVVPILVQAAYGIDFLQFTEQVGSIWNTTSLPESLRLMGYWPSYLGVGYGDVLHPYFGTSATMLFSPLVLVCSLLVPALALWGFVWTRRWRYGPFFVLLALTGVLIMTVGFPEGTPLRRAATFTYNHVTAVQFLRTTYKAGPLLALAIACLGGVAFAELWRRLLVRRVVLALAAVAVVAVASWPLFQGRAVELTWKRIPPAWTQVASDLDRGLQQGSRAVVLPGQPFAFYRWGGTVDPILPALTDRPVAIRNVPPYDDLHAVDLLWTVDNLVNQQRLLPGELRPLLDLLSARAVVTGSDDDPGRSGGMAPAEAARVLASSLGGPARSYGPVSSFAAPADTLDPGARLPEVRRYDIAGSRGLVRVEPASGETVVDGSASGIGDAASFGALPRGRALAYGGDLSVAAIRQAAASGGDVVITDSNRRQAFVASRPRQSYGWTLPASEPFSADTAVLDPFDRGSDAQTVAAYSGATSVHAPFSPQIAQFPEHRPYAAFDGDVRTTWIADPTLEDARHWVEADLPAPRSIPFVDLLPDASNPLVVVTRVDVNGRSFAVHPGWNRLPVRLSGARSVRVTITGHRTLGEDAGSVGGIREVRVPGLRVREMLRPPVLAERALAGADVSHSSLTYLFSRTTADDPLRRGPEPPASSFTGNRAEDEAALVRTAVDPEGGIDRVFSPPAARAWRFDAWSVVGPAASDASLDRVAGASFGGATFTSSARFQGRPGWRASSAFDGSSGTAWVAPWQGAGAWIAWRLPRAHLVRTLHLSRSSLPARFPTSVRLSWPGGRLGPLPVSGSGSVTLPRPVRARSFRLDVLAAGGSTRPAVALASVSGNGVPVVSVPRSGALAGRCGDMTATLGPKAVSAAPASGAPASGSLGSGSPASGSLPSGAPPSGAPPSGAPGGGAPTSGSAGGLGRSTPEISPAVGTVRLRATGSVADLDAGRPLRAAQCGSALELPAGRTELHVPPDGLVRPLTLRLRSAAPDPIARVARVAGRILDPGHMGRGSYDDVRVQVSEPSWLVLGESYNRGWRAECDGHDLGAPRVVDGFANGWRVEPGCTKVSLSFGPQRAVLVGYIVGGLACLALLVLLFLRRRSIRVVSAEQSALSAGDDVPPKRLPLPRALAAGTAAAVVFGFVFALRAGVVIGPATALILWRGFATRTLVTAAGALLALVVPALYLIFPAHDRGGYDTRYPVERLGAHWVTVAAVTLLILALARELSRASRSSRGRAAAAPDADAGRSAP